MRTKIIKIKCSQKKKKGFTLTELIAVMAIIAILSSAIAPKVLGYIEKGKKTNAMEEARQVVLAVDSYNISNSGSEIGNQDTYSDFSDELKAANFIDTNDIKYINSENSYDDLYKIVKGADFSLVDGKIKVS